MRTDTWRGSKECDYSNRAGKTESENKLQEELPRAIVWLGQRELYPEILRKGEYRKRAHYRVAQADSSPL